MINKSLKVQSLYQPNYALLTEEDLVPYSEICLNMNCIKRNNY